MQRTISLLVSTRSPAVLERVLGLLRRRSQAVASCTLGSAERAGLGRATIVLHGQGHEADGLMTHLRKLPEVLKVHEVSGQAVQRQWLLVRIAAPNGAPPVGLQLHPDVRLLATESDSLVYEFAGTPAEVDAKLEHLGSLPILSLTRTGCYSLPEVSHGSLPEAAVAGLTESQSS